MELIEREPGTTYQSLMRSLNLSLSSVSTLVSYLRGQGLVEVRRDHAICVYPADAPDRRQLIVRAWVSPWVQELEAFGQDFPKAYGKASRKP